MREVHPKVCLWALDRDEPMRFRKKGPVRVVERPRVLGKAGPWPGEILDEVCFQFLRRRLTKEDILRHSRGGDGHYLPGASPISHPGRNSGRAREWISH